LPESIHEEDFVVRTGGDEFTIILPKMDALQGQEFVQRMIQATSDQKLKALSLSLTFGLATKDRSDKNIAESYIVMTNDCAYHQRKCDSEAIVEIKAQSGKQFDPALVALLEKILQGNG
jgi:GGDEF domain-containing protein